ncbi:MAG: zinc ABC transporter substrate-binding protein [Clostridia bacterium]|nr:zinc ABC transporter substrate-binding protein [Clostridia bacterium]
MKKRMIAIIVAVCLVLGSVTLAACTAKKNNTQTNDNTGKKLSIVTTIFPEYDWVINILGDKAEDADITMLLDNGVDLHNYQPTADDLIKISNCDLFIYVGGESDEWVEDTLANATNKNIKVINLLEVLGSNAKEEEIVEGMEAEEHEHEDGEEEHEEEEGPEYDEHVWLSLKNAQLLVSEIAKELSAVDSANASVYAANAEAYNKQLSEIDAQYEASVKAATTKTLLFGDRFPFRYMADDYGLDYYAAFVGCSAETEASFETISFLAGKVDELGLKHVIVIENSDKKIANTIISTTTAKDADIITMNSLQSTTSQDIKSGTTYLSVMQDNLSALKEALS